MEKNLGHATAYGYAKSKGYSGTEDEFAQLMADYASVGQSAAQSAEQAAASATSASGSAATATQSAQTATSKASEAVTAANTATTKASEASTSADTASTAAQTATDKASEATTAATTATAKASEASELAATATTAKTDAESARDAAAQSASEAAESARTLTIDATLTKSGQAADAKVVGDEITALKSAFDDIDDILYPNKNVVITSVPETSQATANVYYDISLLKVSNSYRIVLTISNAIHLSNIRTSKSESGSGAVDVITDTFVGDSWATGKTLIYTPNVDGIKYLQMQFNSAYVANEAIVSIVVYDYSKEQETAIQELKNYDTEIQKSVSAITPEIYLEDEYNLLPPFGYTVGKIILPTGVITNYGAEVLSDYIPIDPSQEYICNWAKTASVVYGNSDLTGNASPFDRTCFCFFDENKNVVPFTGNTSAVSKEIPENAKYIRVTILSEQLYPLARLIYGNYESQPIVRICDYHKRYADIYAEANTGMENFKMVMFGDSITHGSLSAGDEGISYVDYANDYLHSNIINVGFGGTRMTYPTIEGASLFCFRNLIDCIVSDSEDAWDALDAYASSDNTSYLPHLNTLKAIDWSKVHAVGLLYGANDFTSNTPVGNSYNEDVLNYDGACASALKKLLTKYPHLQVMILAPFDREMTAGDASTMTDRQENTKGLLMSDYADSLENVVSRFHCPLIKTDKLFGINQYTILTYAPDGTHPRANVAQKRLGWLFAQAVKTHLAPFNG